MAVCEADPKAAASLLLSVKANPVRMSDTATPPDRKNSIGPWVMPIRGRTVASQFDRIPWDIESGGCAAGINSRGGGCRCTLYKTIGCVFIHGQVAELY